MPTAVPSPAPTIDKCTYTYVACGETVAGSTVGMPNYFDTSGNPSAEVNFLIPVMTGVQIVATTCSANTAINTKLTLYDTCPQDGGSILKEQEDPFQWCSVLSFDATNPGSYWMLMQGSAGDEEGDL